MLLTLVSAGLAFQAPAISRTAARQGAVSMSESVGRRELLVQGSSFAASLALLAGSPAASWADGANSKQQVARARAIYGSRVYRLAGASPARILEEKAAFKLFITGAYRSVPVKAEKDALTALSQEILAAAAAGDSAAAQAGVKKFIAEAKLEEQDRDENGSWNPKQRRNAGAPPTAEILAQMGTEKYALYTPLPDKPQQKK